MACVRQADQPNSGHVGHLLAQTSPTDVLEAAAFHAVSGMAYDCLREHSDAPDELVADLRARHEDAVRRHMRMVWELGRLQEVLDGSGAEWAVVKGPALVELLYRRPGLRSYGDIDVIVQPSRFDRALGALLTNGSHLLDRNWKAMRRELLGELHLLLPGGTPLDLHWNLVNMYRGSIRIDTEALLGRAERVAIGSVRMPTPDPTDTLIHLALHGTLAGGDKLLWMKDIAMSASIRPPDWDAVIGRSEEWNIAAPVGFMLARSHRVLGAAVPAEVRRRLLGRQYGALMQIVDRLSPWERARGRLGTPSLLLTRSMGLGLAGASRWLVSRTLRSLDPREPEASSTFTPRGDRSDYEAFLRAVVHSGTS